MRSLRRTLLGTIAAATLVAAPATASVERDLDPLESYTYVRVLDGRATLASQGEGPGEEAELNQPLLSGDRVSVARGARLELSLADRNLLRVGGDSALTLTRIAFSGDRGDRTTRIELHEGEIVLVVTSDALGDSLPEVATPGAEVVVHEPGSYRIETDRSGWTELVVREGFAEVVTARGSTIVRAGESAVAYGDRRSGVDVASAGAEDTLERWGRALDAGAQSASSALLHVEPELAYQAAPLAESGSWVSYDSAWYWRPTAVAVDWRPYWSGRWLWTPSGLTWVSSEPWAWVTYHYGTWCQVPGYGWAWRPGRVYSPAWVYWHWSDAWVGWCPVGYYTGWYGPGYYGPGFRWGVYGWSSGSWGYYSSWNFCPTRRLRHCDPRHDLRRGRDLDRELGGRVPRGLVTTDTRGLPRDRFTEEGAGSRELLGRVNRRLEAQPMVDVTDFVARRRDLPPAVEKAVRAEPEARIRLADVPRVASDDPRTTRPGTRPGSGEDLGSRRVTTERTGSDGRPGTTARDLEPRPAPPGRRQTEG
ncbi:MAG TPA: FecR family protein, partial [Thermoanaerobaculia bacterium]|nr:FecR family protein [Thermoanaerobaculia bacterium]